MLTSGTEGRGSVDCEGVRFTYDGERFALDGVSLAVAPGEFVCVLGGNGSGKSTLAKHINALLVPDEGRVMTGGMDTSDEACVYAVRQLAGMVFQNPDDQLVASVVEDDVAFGPENLGIELPELRERVTESLKAVGLSGFERNETNALSGGQKQRVAIAGALAMHPQILVLDEASAMLDPRGRRGLMRVARELNQAGMTIVMITHFMEEAADADRVVVLDGGRIAAEGTPDEVLTQAERLRALNLDVPFACELALELSGAGVPATPTVSEDALASQLAALIPQASASKADEASAAAVTSTAADANGSAPGVGGTLQRSEAPQPSLCSAPPTQSSSMSSAQAHNTSGDSGVKRREGCGASDRSSTPESPSAEADSPSSCPLISFENVSFTYDAAAAKRQKKTGKEAGGRQAKWGNAPDALWALSDVSLEVRKGEFLGIAGHTGSGKSTLIQHMNGLLTATSGRVCICGSDLAGKGAANEARSKVGLVMQYPEQQLFAATVEQDVAFGPRNLGLTADEASARVREALAQVGLDVDEIGQKSPFELSGGQQRRVAFAGVLAMRPEVLVLDEPAAGLDPKARKGFLAMVKRLHEGGLTVVMVSHSMDDLAQLCDRVVVMNEGRIALSGSPAEVFSQAQALKDIGLATTFPVRFASLLRAKGLPLPDGFITQAQLVQAIAQLSSAKFLQAAGVKRREGCGASDRSFSSEALDAANEEGKR